MGEKRLICELFLEAEHLNSKGTIHGGLTASLTDIITAQCLGLSVNTGMASVELAVRFFVLFYNTEAWFSYLLPAKMGDTLEITATVLKCGKNMAFTEAEFRRKSDGKLCARVFPLSEVKTKVSGKTQSCPTPECSIHQCHLISCLTRKMFINGCSVSIRESS